MLETPPRILADNIRGLEELRCALRQRAEALGISRITLDEVSGMTPGYAAKVLAPQSMKQIGKVSLPLLLGALGVKLILAEDPVALERVRSRLTPRQSSQLRMSACLWGRSGKQYEVSRRWIKKVAAKGGRVRAQALTPKQRSKQASIAATIRWRDVKAAMAEHNAKYNGGKR
jgi:hypothetical protein